MPLTSDGDIARVLRTTRSIALLGASASSERPSHRVMKYLLDRGYQVYPVNPRLAGRQLLGRTVYPSLEAVPARIDMVDVFRQPRHLPDIVEQAVAAGVDVIWTQLGVVDEHALAAAENRGLEVVMDRCPAIEIPRLEAAGLI